MTIDSTIDALDTVNDILDNTLGIAETLRLKAAGNAPDEDDYIARMLSSVAYQQADRLMEVSAYLEQKAQQENA